MFHAKPRVLSGIGASDMRHLHDSETPPRGAQGRVSVRFEPPTMAARNPDVFVLNGAFERTLITNIGKKGPVDIISNLAHVTDRQAGSFVNTKSDCAGR